MSIARDTEIAAGEAAASGPGATPSPSPFPGPSPGAPLETAGTAWAEPPAGPSPLPGPWPSPRDGAPVETAGTAWAELPAGPTEGDAAASGVGVPDRFSPHPDYDRAFPNGDIDWPPVESASIGGSSGDDRPTEGVGFNFTKPPAPQQPAAQSDAATDPSELLDFSRVDTASLSPLEELLSQDAATATTSDQPDPGGGDGLGKVATAGMESIDASTNPDVVRFPITVFDDASG